MKKFILAVATGVCAFSAHAEDPKAIDFNVQLQGDVPSQAVFEVAPVGWTTDAESQFAIPAGWTGSEVYKELPFRVKSSYGAVRVTLSMAGSTVGGDWYLKADDGVSKLSLKRQVMVSGKDAWTWADKEKIEVASKEIAKNGGDVKLRFGVYSKEKNPVRSGVSYRGEVSAVFETDFAE